MIRRSFQVGLTIGLVAGVAAAVAKLRDARRTDDLGTDPWAPLPPVNRPAAPMPSVPAASPPAPPASAPAAVAPTPAPEPPLTPAPPPVPTPAADEHEELVGEVTHAVDEPPVPAETEPAPAKPARRRPVSARKAPAATKGPTKKAPPKKSPKPWVNPADDGTCPTSHPVKAKLTSEIFHLPGMLNYQRTKPDRCYRSAETAEKDGLRRSKR